MNRKKIIPLVAVLISFCALSKAETYKISGKIFGGGKSLRGATVNLKSISTGQSSGSVVTGSNGFFSFSVENGTYNIQVISNNPDFVDSNSNQVTIDKKDVSINIVIAPTITIEGKVTMADGTPIENAIVYIRGSNNYPVYTDKSGNYKVNVLSGTYEFNLQKWNYGGEELPSYFKIDRIIGNTYIDKDSRFDLMIPPVVTLSGRITDPEGTPTPNSTIEASASWTDENGVYYRCKDSVDFTDPLFKIRVFSHDRYRLSYNPPPSSHLLGKILSYSILTNETKDFALNPSPHHISLSGHLRDHSGVPIPDGDIIINSETDTFEAITDETGFWSTKVRKGTYRISAYDDCPNKQLSTYWKISNIVSNVLVEEDTYIELKTSPTASLSGFITYDDGSPIPNSIIQVVTTHSPENAGHIAFQHYSADGNGHYQIELWKNKIYQIKCIPPDSSAGEKLYENIVLSDDANIDFSMNPAYMVTSSVKQADGTAIAHSILNFSGENFNHQKHADSNGLDIHMLGQGQWSFGFEKGENVNPVLPDYWKVDNFIKNFDIGSNVNIDFRLPSVKNLNGLVQDTNGFPIPGITVNVKTSPVIIPTKSSFDHRHQEIFANTTRISDENGYFEVPLFSNDTYDIDILPPSSSDLKSILIKDYDINSSDTLNITLHINDNQKPIFLSGPHINNISDKTAIVSWQTNEPTTSLLYIGETPSPSTIVSIAGYRTNHQIMLENLQPETTYYAQASATDRSGNGPVLSLVQSFNTLAEPDKDSPLILSGPTLTYIGTDTATIEWKTSEPANSSVNFGLSDSLEFQESNQDMVLEHKITLNGLTPSNRYFFNVSSTDGQGNGPTTSDTHDFYTLATSDIEPPIIIAGPLVIHTSESEATITWITNEPATSGVSYNDENVFNVIQKNELTFFHFVRLTGLSPATSYSFIVSSKDASGNGPTLSKERQFQTRATSDTSPPIITVQPTTSGITNRSARVRWRTDEPSDSIIEYGLDPTDLQQRVSRAKLVRKHNLSVVNLEANTRYFYRVGSTNSKGLRIWSNIQDFQTRNRANDRGPSFTVKPKLIHKTATTATIYWETDKPADTVVDYGLNGQTNLRREDPEKTIRHQMTLAGLQKGVTYTVKATSTDLAGNSISEEGLSSDSRSSSTSFTTNTIEDTTAPVFVSLPEVLSISDTTVLIRWETDEIADTQISYGEDGDDLTLFSGDIDHISEHLIMLTRLKPSTTYSFRAGSSDLLGNGPSNAPVAIFRTLSNQDTTPPQLMTQPIVSQIGDTSALITWETDEFSTSQVDFGAITSLNAYRESSDQLTNQHQIMLTNLEPGLEWHFQVTSTDPAGNITQSNTNSFSTSGDKPLIRINDITIEEGDAQNVEATFNLSISQPISELIRVAYATSEGSGSEGNDYEAHSGNLEFAPGETEKTITVLIYGDTQFEEDENFSLVLSDAVNANLATSAANCTILNDDYGCAQINTHPVDQNLCIGSKMRLSVDATGTELTYQWRKDGVSISGANTPVLEISSISGNDLGDYDCLVSNACEPAVSKVAEVRISEGAPEVQLFSNDYKGCLGRSVSLGISVTANGTESFQWYKDGSPIPGADRADYTIESMTLEDIGAYTCEVNNNCGNSMSEEIDLSLSPIEISLTTPSLAQGLNPLTLEFVTSCTSENTSSQWENMTTGEVFPDTPILELAELLSETTTFELTILDLQTGQTHSEKMTVLVASDPNFLDLNGDGCNTKDDLYMLLGLWQRNDVFDANGDNQVDLRDYLYINTGGGCN